MLDLFSNWSTAFIISQLLIVVAMILDYLSFKQETKKWILFFLVPSAALIGLHYFLLDKATTSLIYVIAVARLFIGTYTQDEWNRINLTQTFLIIQSTLFIVFFDEDLSILAYAAHCLFIVGTFQRSDKELRIAFMVGTFILIIYNAIIFSPAAVISELVYLFSNLRHYKKHYLS